jgi:hypothetical protein
MIPFQNGSCETRHHYIKQAVAFADVSGEAHDLFEFGLVCFCFIVDASCTPVRCGELLCEPVGWNFHFVPYEIAAALLCPAFPFRCIPDAICCIWSVSQHMLSVCVFCLGFC